VWGKPSWRCRSAGDFGVLVGSADRPPPSALRRRVQIHPPPSARGQRIPGQGSDSWTKTARRPSRTDQTEGEDSPNQRARRTPDRRHLDLDRHRARPEADRRRCAPGIGDWVTRCDRAFGEVGHADRLERGRSLPPGRLGGYLRRHGELSCTCHRRQQGHRQGDRASSLPPASALIHRGAEFQFGRVRCAGLPPACPPLLLGLLGQACETPPPR
jgi:hypothetical protein